MSSVRARNTGIEKAVSSALRSRRVYFARHAAELPGRPDIVFRHLRLAVFVDGDFWHGRNFREWQGKLNAAWKGKIGRNIERDRQIDRRLRSIGWHVLHVWGSDIKRSPSASAERIIRRLRDLRPAEGQA
jgi:DNA mismatch endonuclease (patch repair protein)